MRTYSKIYMYLLLLLTAMVLNVRITEAQLTQKIMLSGTGSDHMVPWDFYCTAGMHCCTWTKIGVPSNWELQGFGTYNYGLDKDSLRTNEEGFYRYHFRVPAGWRHKMVHIVFEGAMTDTKVAINGHPAGPVHQGSFYRFTYEISSLLNYGKSNLLEVTVAKNSANNSVNKAERKGDFWIFGGIYRPVYLEAMPEESISRVSVNARADGGFYSRVSVNHYQPGMIVSAQLYDHQGQKVGEPVISDPRKDSASVITLATTYKNLKLWSPEFPNLYNVVFTLKKGAVALHQVDQKVGFRTIEVRQRDGIYINGVKVKFKGVCHHSFWPSTGRASSKNRSIADVLLIKDMNMNAVRMSHYPPDDHFLDACDSLGLFVLDELTGWHQAYDTEAGSKLVQEMITRDEDHPSVVIWDNGNEGGFNFDLDPLFARYDLQHRPLIHPWAIFGGMDTQHYINYDYGNGSSLQGHNIVFPTEFLHGLYDGGLGAGLYDFWNEMWHNPLSAGGFLWVFADEDVVRTDKNGMLDSDGDHAPDGILGPWHQKEGSYNAIKEIWSPVFIEHREITPAFDGTLRLQNRYAFTNLNQCRISWKLIRQSDSLASRITGTDSGHVECPSIEPHHWGILQLSLPDNFAGYDELVLRATDVYGKEIYCWTWPVRRPQQKAAAIIATMNQGEKPNGRSAIQWSETGNSFEVRTGVTAYTFSRKTGILQKVMVTGMEIPFNNGPVLCDGDAEMTAMTVRNDPDSLVLTGRFDKKSDLQQLRWTIYPGGLLKMEVAYFPKQYESDYFGVSFSYPETKVKAVEWMGDGPYRVWKNRLQGVTLGVWDKNYNNTITGQPEPAIQYPEFKGYYSNFYWMNLKTMDRPVRVICASEDVFLRLYTPASPARPYHTAPAFPGGDISFMHAIDPVGTKSQLPENMGPSGKKNMYYDYGKDPAYAKHLTLYFDFSASD